MTPSERQERILEHKAELRFRQREHQRNERRIAELRSILSTIYGVTHG